MTQEQDDPIWAAAWTWVQREFDRAHFDEAARLELARWLAEDPEHTRQHQQATRLWALAGQVPARAQDPDELPARDPREHPRR
jgi:transmembrane sensor